MRKQPLITLALVCLVGCGESERAKTRRLINQAVSQVNVTAEKLAEQVGEDGWFKRDAPRENDPWGNPLQVKYERTGSAERLEVRSFGPDSLPRTADDVRAVYTLNNDEVKKARREDALERGGRSLMRGVRKGVTEGVREAMKR
jgi:hypothetical protein